MEVCKCFTFRYELTVKENVHACVYNIKEYIIYMDEVLYCLRQLQFKFPFSAMLSAFLD